MTKLFFVTEFNCVAQHWPGKRLSSCTEPTCTSVLVGAATSASEQATRYDTIRDAILTCARKPTRVSLIYRTEPTTKKCKNRRRKTRSRKQVCSEITVNSLGNPRSEYLSRRKEGLQWEGFAEKEGFKPGMKE